MDIVKEIIDSWDPVGLFPYCPDDEYHSEIEAIHQLLNRTKDLNAVSEGVFQILTESFGQDTLKITKEECMKIAKLLLHEILRTI